MNTGLTHFKNGNKIAKAKSGRKHRLTLLREKLGLKNIEDLKEDVLNIWFELLNSKSIVNRRFAVKELSKYIFSVKRIVTEEKERITLEEFLIADYRSAKEEEREKEIERERQIERESKE